MRLSDVLIPTLSASSCRETDVKCLQISLTELHMTIPSPEPSSSQRSEGRRDSKMASEPEQGGGSYTAEEDVSCRCSTSPEEAPLSPVTSAQQNASNLHPRSDASANNLASQQSEFGVSNAADSKVHDTDSWRVSIDDLPDETLLKIFSHMSFNELVYVVQRVSPRWRRLSQDLDLWADKEYEIRYWYTCDTRTLKGGTTDQEAVQIFCDAPNLRKVTMRRGARSRVFRALYNRCHRLSELRLHVNQKLSYSVLKNLVEKCSKIQALSISSELLKSEKFSEAVSSLQHLRVLELEVHYPFWTPVLRPLGDGCPRLAEVDFRLTVLDVDDLSYFLNAKRNTLKTVYIKWTMAGKRCIVPLLTVCADSLERLELYEYDVVRDEAREAFIALGRLKSLQALAMKISDPAPPSTAALAFKAGGLQKLRFLDLRYGFSLDDDTVIAVSRGCPALQKLLLREAELLSDAAFSQIHRLKQLEMLDVSCCSGLGGALIPCIARLPRLHTLLMEELEFPKLQPGLSSMLELCGVRCLSLDYSLVTGVPFDKFPGKLVSLRELNIQGCRGDPKATDGLAEQMPDLKIHGSIEEEEPASDAEGHESDMELEEEENEANAGPGDAEGARDDSAETGDDCDGDNNRNSGSEADNDIWDESSISLLFVEDI